MTPCCANSHNSMPLRVLTVRTSLHTYISYAHKYTYIKNHITDMLVYRRVLCTLTLVCALANAPTLNLFVYMHMLTSMYIYIDHITDAFIYEPALCELTYMFVQVPTL